MHGARPRVTKTLQETVTRPTMTAVPRRSAPPPLPMDAAFALPEPVAETRSIAALLDLVALENQAPFCRHLEPSASFFRASLRHGGHAQQSSNACTGLLLADRTEDYLAQVACSSRSRRVRFLHPR